MANLRQELALMDEHSILQAKISVYDKVIEEIAKAYVQPVTEQLFNFLKDNVNELIAERQKIQNRLTEIWSKETN